MYFAKGTDALNSGPNQLFWRNIFFHLLLSTRLKKLVQGGNKQLKNVYNHLGAASNISHVDQHLGVNQLLGVTPKCCYTLIVSTILGILCFK